MAPICGQLKGLSSVQILSRYNSEYLLIIQLMYYSRLEKVNRVSSLGMFVKIKNVQKNKPSFDTNWLKISKCIVNDQLKY